MTKRDKIKHILSCLLPTTIHHLHGELSKLRSSFDPSYVIDYVEDLKPGDLCPDGAQMRPAIVLFGENLPYSEYDKSLKAIREADVVVIVGTSMQVYPAASMPWESKETALIYYIDPNEMGFLYQNRKDLSLHM